MRRCQDDFEKGKVNEMVDFMMEGSKSHALKDSAMDEAI